MVRKRSLMETEQWPGNLVHKKERFCISYMHHVSLISPTFPLPDPLLFTDLSLIQEKKALQERERRRLREEEDREMASIINPQLREKENLNALLGSLDLTVVDIQPDGNW